MITTTGADRPSCPTTRGVITYPSRPWTTANVDQRPRRAASAVPVEDREQDRQDDADEEPEVRHHVQQPGEEPIATPL